ncbi:retinitis pigmentosa 1-like 1 protein isoform X2 [Triplophysa rosa]|uniref:Fibrous sheath CABYR-binding protein-like n=1 Tax=Triplophysa rosa TaxID=992332 RepID=A0A9W7W9S0_TRIRA|nr:retinitis pigmentosa 1-like 1 protein isoform X2 [Triplophysa rosa]KAI7792376.1 putative fibrous sheath CABYR-binding protein-like [Triplophysa rosa]
MGNCCTKFCGQKSPCDHTEDETKGLLHSSESKTSTKAGTEPCTGPISDEEKGHEEETKPELDESVTITKQPVVAETLKAQSCYSSQIAVLQTEHSQSSEVNPNASVEPTEAPAEAECLAIETKTEAVQEIPNIAAEASVDAPAEAVVSQAKLETEGQHGSPESVDVAPAATDEAGVSATSQDSTLAPVKEPTAAETPVEEATLLAQTEAEKSPESKPEAHVTDEKETLQTEEQPLSDITDVKHEDARDAGDVSVTNSNTRPDSLTSGQSNDLDAIEKSITKVTSEDPTIESAAKVKKPSEDARSDMDKVQQQTSEVSETQEYIKQVSSPVVDVTNGLSPDAENGLVKESNQLSMENETHAAVTVVEEVPQKEDAVQKPSEEPGDIESEELFSKPSTYTDSTIEVDVPEVMNSVTNQEKNEEIVQQVQEAAEPTHNGLNSTGASEASSPVEKTISFEQNSESVAVEAPEVKGDVIALMEEKSPEPHDGAEPEPQQREEETEKQEEDIEKQENEKQEREEERQEDEKQKEQANVDEEKGAEKSETQKAEVLFSSEKVEVRLIPVTSEGSVGEVHKLDDADLYLGEEETELGASKDKPSKAVLELTIPGVESRSSLAPAVDILAYSEREWKGNTAKSALIRKGYTEMSRSFIALKQVRGDNYCALRATLYQVLATSTKMPTWLQDEGFLSLPDIIEARKHLIGGWVFPPVCAWGCEKNSVERLKHYLDLLKKKWEAAAACESPEERQSLCERVFQGGEEEYGLLEALKFLMLAKAIELHGNMTEDQEVPVFCWLLFARDTSENPQTLLANHLSQIGFSGGVEQVEMFLLGYALQHTIQAFRLYMTETVEFVTHYPDDHKQEWPCVCIVTEDDRHYNVPVRRTAQHQQ